MADGANPISARVATALGLLCVVVGFGLVGAAVINGIAWADGAMPVDDVAPGTLFVVRLTRYLLGLGIVGLKTTIFGWIAFGPGHDPSDSPECRCRGLRTKKAPGGSPSASARSSWASPSLFSPLSTFAG